MLSDLALAILRVTVGLIIAGHGAQKLFGWLDGDGVEGTAGFFGSLRVREPKDMAMAVGAAEFLGGIGLTLGLLTPFAAAAIASSMLGAIALAHWPHFWVNDSGFEYPAVVLASVTMFGFGGSGGWSLDAAIGTDSFLPNPWTYIALAAAVSLGVFIVASRRLPEREPAHDEGVPAVLAR